MNEEAIRKLEAELRLAQLHSDVAALDRLIDDALLFTGPDGTLATKAEDLALHRNRLVEFTLHEPSEMQFVIVTDDVVVVAMRTHLAGRYQNAAFAGDFRYTRVWARRGESWRIVAGHVSAVPLKT
ncbi:MAG: nuclear transport factor 2 family protein [Phycisphaerae bacterium]|nr:nuclear transport factor 2 family protein [Gemmatimonadaceae bacterium]